MPAPRAQPLTIAGPAGALEALLEEPAAEPGRAAPAGFAVLCHPHPLYGGTMTNKVITTLARAFLGQGLATLRFNFRGVGASAGQYDEGRGETEDALAVVAWGRRRWPGAALVLAGFSFGAKVALRAAAHARPARLVSVAPALSAAELAGLTVPTCPWLIIQGDADEVVDPRAVRGWAAQLSPAPRLTLLAGAGHFFHGRLAELREAVIAGTADQPHGPDVASRTTEI